MANSSATRLPRALPAKSSSSTKRNPHEQLPGKDAFVAGDRRRRSSLSFDRAPCNEIGRATLAELEQFVAALDGLEHAAHALIISSARKEGFCAGADLRELYHESQKLPATGTCGGTARLSRAHPSRDEPHRRFAAYDHRRGSRRYVRRRIRACAHLRPDHRRQNDALLFPGTCGSA